MQLICNANRWNQLTGFYMMGMEALVIFSAELHKDATKENCTLSHPTLY